MPLEGVKIIIMIIMVMNDIHWMWWQSWNLIQREIVIHMLRPIIVRHLIWKLNHRIILPFGGPLTSKAADIANGHKTRTINWLDHLRSYRIRARVCKNIFPVLFPAVFPSSSGDVDLPIMPFTSSSAHSGVCPQNTYSACYPPSHPPPDRPHYSKQL